MSKAFFTVIFLLFSVPAGLSFAQGGPGGIKIYSGYLHRYDVKSKTSFWHALFGAKPARQEEVVHDRQCSIEFKSPIPFSQQSVAVIPEELAYFVRFKDGPRPSQADGIKGKSPFDKFIIKIYTGDDEEYSIDPGADGKQAGINDEHHIFDSYLIYLILGPDINRVEIVSPSGDAYILDKLEIHDNH